MYDKREHQNVYLIFEKNEQKYRLCAVHIITKIKTNMVRTFYSNASEIDGTGKQKELYPYYHTVGCPSQILAECVVKPFGSNFLTKQLAKKLCKEGLT